MKDKIYIDRIVKYGHKIGKYLENINSLEELESNDEKIDAIILNLEQIGETAKKISEETKLRFPSIKWISIIGLRNIISHDYEGVKLSIIYDVSKSSIPTLIDQLKEIEF